MTKMMHSVVLVVSPARNIESMCGRCPALGLAVSQILLVQPKTHPQSNCPSSDRYFLCLAMTPELSTLLYRPDRSEPLCSSGSVGCALLFWLFCDQPFHEMLRGFKLLLRQALRWWSLRLPPLRGFRRLHVCSSEHGAKRRHETRCDDANKLCPKS